MSKKILVPLVLALVAALAFSGIAFAKSKLPAGDVRRVGEVLSVNMAGNSFRFATNTGARYDFHVTSSTMYIGFSGLSALKADNRLNLEVKRLSDGAWTVVQAKLLPDMNETEAREGTRIHGVVVGITASTITIRTRTNETFIFDITSKTHFSGHGVPHLRELKLGDAVTVNFRRSGSIMDATSIHVTRD